MAMHDPATTGRGIMETSPEFFLQIALDRGLHSDLLKTWVLRALSLSDLEESLPLIHTKNMDKIFLMCTRFTFWNGNHRLVE
jgi:hypothetical protein